MIFKNRIPSLFSIMILSMIIMLAACASDSKSEANTNNNIDYPARNVQIVIPYDAGGGADVIARKLVEIIRERDLFPEEFTVVNLPGASTMNALEEVLGSDPDGHTILFHHSAIHTMSAINQIDMSYSDFSLIGSVATNPSVIVTSSEGKHDNIEDFVQDAKNDPESVTLGHAGEGSTSHLIYNYAMNEGFGETNLFKEIPYQSGAEVQSALLANDVDLIATTVSDVINHVESGDFVPLVVSKLEKYDPFPEAKAISDLGGDIGLELSFGFYSHPDTPEQVKDILEGVLKEAAETDEFSEFLKSEGGEANFLNAEEMREHHEEVQEIFDDLAEELGIVKE